jgi:hypothetical protein
MLVMQDYFDQDENDLIEETWNNLKKRNMGRRREIERPFFNAGNPGIALQSERGCNWQ